MNLVPCNAEILSSSLVISFFLFVKQSEQNVGLTVAHRPGIGCYTSSVTMVEVLAAHFVPEAANPETTKVGAVCVTWQSRKKEVMTLLSYPHHPLCCEKKPFSHNLLESVYEIQVSHCHPVG